MFLARTICIYFYCFGQTIRITTYVNSSSQLLLFVTQVYCYNSFLPDHLDLGILVVFSFQEDFVDRRYQGSSERNATIRSITSTFACRKSKTFTLHSAQARRRIRSLFPQIQLYQCNSIPSQLELVNVFMYISCFLFS